MAKAKLVASYYEPGAIAWYFPDDEESEGACVGACELLPDEAYDVRIRAAKDLDDFETMWIERAAAQWVRTRPKHFVRKVNGYTPCPSLNSSERTEVLRAFLAHLKSELVSARKAFKTRTVEPEWMVLARAAGWGPKSGREG